MMTVRYDAMTIEEILDRVRLYEENPTIHDINRSQYVEMLNELYRRDPHKYFRKWYFFKTFPRATMEEWKLWEKFCNYFDGYIEEKNKYVPPSDSLRGWYSNELSLIL